MNTRATIFAALLSLLSLALSQDIGIITAKPTATGTVTCETKTVSTHPTCCPEFDTKTCMIAMCIMISTVNMNCGCGNTIPTKTVYTACPTACHGGCATTYATRYTPCPIEPTRLTPDTIPTAFVA